jgi:lactoylglutathione lyase
MKIEVSPHPYPVDYKSWIFGLDARQPQFLHAAFRIKHIDPALRFYVEGLSMMVLDRIELANMRITALFLGFGIGVGALELIQYWDEEGGYAHGLGYSHLTIGVPDLHATMDRLETMGTEITSRPMISVAGAAPAAFVKDPDGYAVELVQTRNP